MSASGGLEEWAQRFGGCRRGLPPRGPQRFAFYRRVSTEDWQDPVTSRARRREQAEALVRGHGLIVAEFFDTGQSRSVAWGRRPQAAALLAQLADPGRGWDLADPADVSLGQGRTALEPAHRLGHLRKARA